MASGETACDLDSQLATLLDELTSTQDELLEVLSQKRKLMIAQDLAGMAAMQTREQELADRLEAFQHQRQQLLSEAAEGGVQVEDLQQLASVLESARPGGLDKQARDAAQRMRLIQHESLTNWVLAQRALLHVSQLLEIVATGGRLQPTYGRGPASREASCHARGALMDQEA